MQILSKGISKNTSLKHLSLEFCTIGDKGVEILSKGIKNSPTVTSLNFSGCGLTFQGADVLAKIIKHQSMKRHNEAWRDSLRYRRPDLDNMTGIRRITVNKNPLMGDQGALAFAEALKDDLWLKALDMQQCGISDAGAKALLQVLKFNTTMVVLDLRLNPLIDHEIQESIMEQVLINSDGQDTEYKWIRVTGPDDSEKRSPKRRRTKTSGSYRGRASVKIIPGNGRKRSKSAGAPGHTFGRTYNISDIHQPGLPWRTALRAMTYRGYPNPISGWEKNNGSSPMDSPTVVVKRGQSGDEDEGNESYMRSRGIDDSSLDDSTDLKDVKQLKLELVMLKRRYEEEKEARIKADQQVLQLTRANSQLKRELDSARHGGGAGLLEDDRILDSIEASFKKFHSFLDLLRDAGLGQLITVAGLDHSSMAFPSVSQPGSQCRAFPPPRSDAVHGDVLLNEPRYAYETELLGDEAGRPSQSMYGVMMKTTPPSRDPPVLNQDDGIMTGSIRPHLVPDNYTQSQRQDPTLHPLVEDDEYDFKPSTADELYQKLRRQAEAALERSKIYDSSHQLHATSTPQKSSRSPVTEQDNRVMSGAVTSSDRKDESPGVVQDGNKDKKVSPQPAQRNRSPKSPTSDVAGPEAMEVPDSEVYSDTFEHSDPKDIINLKSMEDITQLSPSPPAVVPESDEDF